MDQLTPATPAVKRRRRFTAEFKQKVLEACDVPGQSVASVARQYDLNANRLHKWRRRYRGAPPPDFVRLPEPLSCSVSDIRMSRTTIRIELPGGWVAHWPVDEIGRSVSWLKALMP